MRQFCVTENRFRNILSRVRMGEYVCYLYVMYNSKIFPIVFLLHFFQSKAQLNVLALTLKQL
jgi:hypothetical protein